MKSCTGTYPTIQQSVKKPNIAILLIAFLAIFYTNQANATSTISGSISLPGSTVAPAGGIPIVVRAIPVTGTGAILRLTTTSVQAGMNSVGFTINGLNNDLGTERWNVLINCDTRSENCGDYVATVFFASGSSGNAVFTLAEADDVGSAANNVNVSLQTGTTFSGNISLPSGSAPAEGVDVNVTIRQVGGNLRGGLSVTIQPGETSAEYKATLPSLDTGSYTIKYDCPGPSATTFSQFCVNNFLAEGFYNGNEPGNTVETVSLAQNLPGNISLSGLDMQLLTGFSISGNLSIASGAVSEDTTFTMVATDFVNNNPPVRIAVSIDQGQASTQYALSIPSDTLARWRVEYFCGASDIACSQFLRGFYDADDPVDTTTLSPGEADTLNGGQDHSGINLTVTAPAFEISGSLRFEEPASTPIQSVIYTVSITSNSGTFFAERLVFSPGDRSLPFSLPVPSGFDNWFLSFSCNQGFNECANFQERGFYSSAFEGNTSRVFSDREPLAGDQSHTNLTLTTFENEDDGVCFPARTQNGGIALICL